MPKKGGGFAKFHPAIKKMQFDWKHKVPFIYKKNVAQRRDVTLEVVGHWNLSAAQQVLVSLQGKVGGQ